MECRIDGLSSYFKDVKQVDTIKDADGWFFSKNDNQDYVSARLTLNDYFNGDIDGSRVILISAPGAVGKSVMAKELCNQTGCIYLDLSVASTIAGNYVIGGLANKNILQQWDQGSVGLVIDSLDEARLRVTQTSFEDFLKDVENVSTRNKNPIIIFGRVGIIEETWLILKENHGLNCPIFDIEFFDDVEAVEFINKSLSKLSSEHEESDDYKHLSTSLRDHKSVYNDSIIDVVRDLKKISGNESKRFFGYAPVLDAVSKVIATISNPAKIAEEMKNILDGKMLLNICNAILIREQGKLTSQLSEKFSMVKNELYSVTEQLERIACRIFGISVIATPRCLSNDLISIYDDAVGSMLPQHPFLDGTGKKTAGSVFEACIISHALLSDNENISIAAKNYCLSGKITPNPFLFDFFVEERSKNGCLKINSSHIGIIYDSVLSKLKNTDDATLIVNDDENMSLSVEFIISEDDTFKEIEFSSDGCDVISLGSKVGGVFINTDTSDVEFSASEQLELISPISIACDKLRINSDKIIIKSVKKNEENVSVVLDAKSFTCDKPIGVPLVRSGAELYVNWPSSDAFPWSAFSNKLANSGSDDRVADALRVFRRIVMAFRSHSKGRLARLQDKINHARMLRDDDGRALLEQLIKDNVISSEGHMYYLEPNTLGRITDAAFRDVNKKNYSAKTIEYVEKAIN
ncbi:hypothetical protein [Serratia marcescens]|uniref:hypothetical protein n=1 Tax=Serratia marcescens TaxID=615 RepID=UPI0011AF5B81|nr:hypothetical protein [Serratia marcescens]WLS86381.1 hypothetical protein RAM09_16070 [Serratia marcescens]HCU0895603.1 hypothetical protein [Serratia marcescens]HEJ7099213.1 hypothetical protein [Serratia marcescens]